MKEKLLKFLTKFSKAYMSLGIRFAGLQIPKMKEWVPFVFFINHNYYLSSHLRHRGVSYD